LCHPPLSNTSRVFTAWPPGEMATELTEPKWPLSVCSRAPVAASQSRTVLSLATVPLNTISLLGSRDWRRSPASHGRCGSGGMGSASSLHIISTLTHQLEQTVDSIGRGAMQESSSAIAEGRLQHHCAQQDIPRSRRDFASWADMSIATS
jgi:hypothetical protein